MKLFREVKYKKLGGELRKAAKDGDRSKVLKLISNGADVNAKDIKSGLTPLHWASYNGHAATAETLLANGADVNAKNNWGRAPLHSASVNGNAAVAQALIANGADFNAKDGYGLTPLHRASQKGHAAVVQTLLANGADINVKENWGETPRDVAVSHRHGDVVKVLDNAGNFPNPNSNDSSSIVPVDARVATAFYKEIMTLDRPGGGDLNERLEVLAALVEDLHMLKLFYTAVASLHRASALSDEEVAALVSDGLSRSSALCVCRDSVAMYKLVLMKAAADCYISEFDRLCFDNDAEVARMANAPFVKDIVESVRANTACIEGLEANVESINASLNKMRRGMNRKLKVEGVVGMFGATLNVISLGAAGGFFSAGMAAFFEVAVDFGDAVHLKSVAEDLGARFPDEQLMEKIDNGVEIGEEALGMYADSLLTKAVKEGNILVVVSANAAMQQHSSKQAMSADAGEETLEAAITDPTDHHQYLSAGESHEEVKEWLLNYLPRLRKEDVEKYCDGLIENGLDSNEMLSHEIEEDDFQFMKNAHKRVLLKKLSQEREV